MNAREQLVRLMQLAGFPFAAAAIGYQRLGNADELVAMWAEFIRTGRVPQAALALSPTPDARPWSERR